jgi:hypothetical protein
MSAQLFSAFIIAIQIYGIAIALFYVRPRAVTHPGEGFHMWKYFLLSTLIPLALAIYTLISIPTLSFIQYIFLSLETCSLNIIPYAIFYMRPRFVGSLNKIYAKWKMMLACGLGIMICGFLLFLFNNF